MVRYSSNCGSQLEENSKLWVNCGSLISKDASGTIEPTEEDIKSTRKVNC
jgi:hypothetical protein